MKKLATIGSLLKKIYRSYSIELLNLLQKKGFIDLRPSFLEVLLTICELEGPTIKKIGERCNLKKQTMTSHLHELEKRGYIVKKVNLLDKREQNVFLTEYGRRFKFSLMESVSELEKNYSAVIGMVELERVEHLLDNFQKRIYPTEKEIKQALL